MQKINILLSFALTACLFLGGCGKDLLAPEGIKLEESGNVQNLERERIKLHWAPPELEDPIVVHVGGTNNVVNGTPDRDMIVVFDSKLTEGLDINGNGARHIFIKGGEIEMASGNVGNSRRSLYLKNWKGVLHIEGVWAHAAPDNVGGMEGINLDSRNIGCTFQFQNCRIDDVGGNAAEAANYTAPGTFHPDIIQNWGGPTYFYVDYLTGETDYQGFMMQPLQFGDNKTEIADFRHVNVLRTSTQGYTIYRAGGTTSLTLSDFWVSPAGHRKGYPESDVAWFSMVYGIPAEGDYVVANEIGGISVAGMNYRSPGYERGAPKPSITVIYPNGGQTLAAGEGSSPTTVTWSSTGKVGNVNIDLTTDNGATWTTLVSNTENDGSEAVILPAILNMQAKIRVMEPKGLPQDGYDESNTSFIILAPQPGWNSKASFTAGVYSLGRGANGIVTINYDVTPALNSIDGLMGFTGTPITVTGFGSYPMAVRLAPNGFFDVRNGGDYAKLISIPYIADTKYHVRMIADLPNRKYSVWVTPPGEPEVQIALDFAFRTSSAIISDIGKVGLKSNGDNHFAIIDLIRN